MPASTRPIVVYAVRVRGIRVQSHMGVSDAEREKLQELIVGVDIELAGDAYPSTDELERAVDYAAVVRATEEGARERHFRLLETFALGLAQRLGDRWPTASQVRVAATKAIVPVTPTPDEASVEVILGRRLT